MKVPQAKKENAPTLDFAINQLINVIRNTPDHIIASVRRTAIKMKLEHTKDHIETAKFKEELELLSIVDDKDVALDFRNSMMKSMLKLDKMEQSAFLGNIVEGIVHCSKMAPS